MLSECDYISKEVKKDSYHVSLLIIMRNPKGYGIINRNHISWNKKEMSDDLLNAVRQLCVLKCKNTLHQHIHHPGLTRETICGALVQPCTFNERSKPHTVCTHLHTHTFPFSPTQSALIVIDSLSGRLTASHYWLPS